MRIYDIIQKKKYGEALTKEEIEFFVDGFTNGKIHDYQASALMMAIWFNGMTDEEITDLTLAMAHSGDMVDLSDVEGFTVDKHSTGGVGDKTTLIVAPIVAACGGKVAKMSGRGLGHTGGTIDKLESISGFDTALSKEDFIKAVNDCGLCVVGQTGNLAPADKKLYALRDVTATVDSIPLIASSIMSKKLAAGSQGIVLDVKTGSGAFMKTVEASTELAQKMVSIGNSAGRKTVALITDMDVPLGTAIGNSLEVKEAINVLCGKQKDDLFEVCIALASNMLCLVHSKGYEECEKMALEAVENGSALQKLKAMVTAQGGNAEWIDCPEQFPKAEFSYDIVSENDGYISFMDAQKIGTSSVVLGAGRESKEDSIDFSAGIILHKKTGDRVQTGDSIATLYSNKKDSFSSAEKLFKNALEFSTDYTKEHKAVIKVIK